MRSNGHLVDVGLRADMVCALFSFILFHVIFFKMRERVRACKYVYDSLRSATMKDVKRKENSSLTNTKYAKFTNYDKKGSVRKGIERERERV